MQVSLAGKSWKSAPCDRVLSFPCGFHMVAKLPSTGSAIGSTDHWVHQPDAAEGAHDAIQHPSSKGDVAEVSSGSEADSGHSDTESESSYTSSNATEDEPSPPAPALAPDIAAVWLGTGAFTKVMLSDPTAPVVTLSLLEDQTLAPAFPLVRLPYLEKLLEVVKHGHASEQYREKLASAVKQAHSDLAFYLAYWGGPVGETNFWIGFRTPFWGHPQEPVFAGRQQKASGFSQTRIAMMGETGEMVGASFLSICVTVGAASFGPPKARNLLSSALPFNVVARAPLFFWWVWRQLAAHPTSEPTPKPQTTW